MMILLSMKKVSKYFGEVCLFDELNFSIEDNHKVGLVGVNGAGKTSLFKLVTGEMKADSGDIYINSSADIGYMKQNIEYDSDKTLWQELISAFSEQIQIEEELENIRKLLDSGDNVKELIKKQDNLMQRYDILGGFEYKSRAKGALIGLGFKERDFDRPFKNLSGGEKTRLLLGRLLLSKHKLLLLDEPTNHLDMNSIIWLESFLKNYNGAFIVISHDRYFLDKTTNMTMGLQNGRIQTYTGSYSDFMKKRDADKSAVEKKFELQKKEISRIEGIIAKQKQWNRERNIKTAESKQKIIDRIKEEMVAPDDDPDTIKFSFNTKEGGANEVLAIQGLSKSFGNKKILENSDLLIKKGERVFLLGDNGCGKTTLLKIILGELSPDKGIVKIGSAIAIGYYEQQHRSLDGNKTVFDEIYDSYPELDRTKIRNALASVLFKNDDCFKLIKDLSGGEKARILLLKLMLSSANFLILDEPTNHLDIFSKEMLEKALKEYKGTLLVVSHDRYFIDSTADKIYDLKDHTLHLYNGNYTYYLDKAVSEPPTEVATDKKQNNDYKEQKELQSKIRKAENQVKRTEEEIEVKEQRLKELDKLLFSEEGQDIEKAMKWHNESEELEKELEELYASWEETQGILSQLK
ncbi:MAG: ABC-F family ATP-binding cassette domain-containing protein [Bacillota bacterium]|nr:ABC-F family ATP-binding cassette domain-containing protein [Bacillota bacterium]